MLNSINKISVLKAKSSLVLFLLLLIFAFNSGRELLHNHKPNEPERDDCPAFIISQTFSNGITIHFELPNEFIVESNIDTPQILLTFQNKPSVSYLRGPPLVWQIPDL
ncbi:MAG: hypothetical protein WC209_04710 [Ignavibacteriaceae bacterium]|jgi:hypothetical protein